MQTNPFWLVWNPSAGCPLYKHSSLESAEVEAQRLARMNRGQEFIVLESVSGHSVMDVVSTDLRPQFEPPF